MNSFKYRDCIQDIFAIDILSRKSLLASSITCPRVPSTWWAETPISDEHFLKPYITQVGNVDEVVAKAEKLLAEAAAN